MAETDAGKEYKDTLNLPRTEFPMKGNLAQLEPKMLAWWAEKKTYERLLEKTAQGPKFVFHDGPPYANGHLHAGHALNKVLKDIVVKFRNLTGRHTDFIPGWDCHGLPIEQAVEKRLASKKIDKRTLSRDQLLEACRAYALEFVDIQREEFKRMGVFGRWDQPYLTLDFAYEAQEIRELATFARRGLLYRRKKPVYWCITDQTALAEAEVEYEDHESPSVYVAMNATGDGVAKLPEAVKGRQVAYVIWTTTPWTLPANLAIAVHPDFEYVLWDARGSSLAAAGDRVLVVAKEMLARFLEAVAPEELAVKSAQLGEATFDAATFKDPKRILAYVSGRDLEHQQYRHPFLDRTSPVILGEHVTLEAGTGLVHTAPGHGQEDYEVGLRYGLDVYNPVNNSGRYDDTVGAGLAGMKVWDANPVIVDKLVEVKALLNQKGETLKHSYPHCWRCRNPIIFAGTWQWFIALDKEMGEGRKTLRQTALHEIDHRVKWIPAWGRDRIYNMLENRPDWTISRQRAWGVPIPVAFCKGCDEAIVSPELMEKVADRVEKEGAGVWYREDLSAFMGADFRCPKCGKKEFRKETDILDVWFDSACSFSAVAGKRPGLGLPVDLYLEGSDQHRGWFHSTLLVGVGTRDRAPYEAVLTHGFVVDGEGRKMSKSLGNTVSPEQMIKQYGAEVMRLWVASSDYRDDVRLSDQILKGLAEGYRKIRNTIRYALSNLYDFDPAKDAVPDDQLLPLDRWAKARTAELVARVRKAYEAYEFHLVYHAVVEFCGVDLSAIYFDILKDRLYTSKATSLERRSAQTVLNGIVRDLLRMLAPVTSFTAEEAWQNLPGAKEESVFFAGFPEAPMTAPDAVLMQTFEKILAVRSAVQTLLEAARRDKLIGASLEARLVLHATGEAKTFLTQHAKDLPSYFIVSQVELVDAAPAGAQPLSLNVFGGGATVSAKVEKARGEKCPRCWAYSEAVGKTAPVCEKCQAALAS
ncbi:MAG: isoleucine--tRNA ligase [Myxococcaceae bacterium]|nr:isoleucine--tRNA ligase [Myxococcaceae bacterium]